MEPALYKYFIIIKFIYGLASQYLCDTFNAKYDIHYHNIRNMPKQQLHTTMVALHPLVTDYGMILLVISTIVCHYLCLNALYKYLIAKWF